MFMYKFVIHSWYSLSQRYIFIHLALPYPIESSYNTHLMLVESEANNCLLPDTPTHLNALPMKRLPNGFISYKLCANSSPRLSNILPSLLFQAPELLRLFAAHIPLHHCHINKCFLHTFTHPLTAPTDEDSAVETVDDEPD